MKQQSPAIIFVHEFSSIVCLTGGPHRTLDVPPRNHAEHGARTRRNRLPDSELRFPERNDFESEQD
jgi:hypothetical protein